ncbi:hypothetical protein K7432_016988 [Basidiobolus ranarum]|uniref:Uncharacterized protein n=1 Tax=Basidiobolus ranarum TaxID=34480 RepID=A0ABR2WE20_9FUNG
MHLSSIKLLFVLSSAWVIAGASVAERDYSPSHHSNMYEANKDWDNQEYPGWRNDQDEYASRWENKDHKRHGDYNHDDDQDLDIEHGGYERGSNRYENRHDKYTNDSHHDEEDWDYDNEGSRKGRDSHYDNNVPSGEDISGENGSLNSGSPAGGDDDAPSGQGNVDPAAGNGTAETTGSKETTKPGSSPAGDATNIHEDDNCRRNLVDGRIDVLGIKANWPH